MKGLANLSRLRIIAVLSKEKELAVNEIAARIHVTLKGTSQHLQILAGLGILDREGKAGQVFYALEKSMDPHIRVFVERILK